MPVKTRLPKRPRALSARREAAARILERLAALYPDAACSLNFANPFELLVATVLSAQTTDARVNAVTPELFSRFPTPAAMATADPRELEAILRPLGFYRAKTKSCLGLAASLCENYGGDFPPGFDSRGARQVDRGGGNRIKFQPRHSHSSSSSATRRSTAAIFAPCLSSG